MVAFMMHAVLSQLKPDCKHFVMVFDIDRYGLRITLTKDNTNRKQNKNYGNKRRTSYTIDNK